MRHGDRLFHCDRTIVDLQTSRLALTDSHEPWSIPSFASPMNRIWVALIGLIKWHWHVYYLWVGRHTLKTDEACRVRFKRLNSVSSSGTGMSREDSCHEHPIDKQGRRPFHYRSSCNPILASLYLFTDWRFRW